MSRTGGGESRSTSSNFKKSQKSQALTHLIFTKFERVVELKQKIPRKTRPMVKCQRFYAFLPPFVNKEQLIAVQIVFGNIPDSWDKASYSKRNPSYTKKIIVRKQWYKYQQCESISPRKLYLKNIYNIPYMYTLQQVLTSSYNKQ